MKKHITLYKREYTVQYTENHLRSCGMEMIKLVKHPLRTHLYYPFQTNECFAVDEKDFKMHIQSLRDHFFKTKKAFNSVESNLKKYGKKYVYLAKSFSKKRKYTNKQLRKQFSDFFKIWKDYTFYLWLTHILNEALSEKITKLIEEKCLQLSMEKELELYLHSIFSPSEKTIIAELRERILKDKRKWLMKENLDKLAKDYSWIPCADLHWKPWKEKDMKHFILSLKPVKKLKIIPLKRIILDLRLNKEEQKLVAIQKRLSYLKDLRDDYRRQAVFFARNLYQNIADGLGINYNEVIYMSKQEIIDALDNKHKPGRAVIKERRKGFLVYINENNKTICLIGKKAKEKMDSLGLPEKQKKEDVLTGTTASKGMAKGVARIVKSVDDLKNVKQGDILVAICTHPEYVPAMNKAAAIITDEGGLTGHAAIVSRELGTPCIVGTKVATKFLKDNDLVEVDANHASIRLIERAK